MAETPLYGSALAAVLPPGAKDVSLLRQIPDNQEVYCHPFTDQSIIIDLLQYVEESDDRAISVHFEELSESNGVAPGEARILQVDRIPVDSLSMECQSAWYILGEQNIAKFNETAKNTVQIHMGLFRLPDVTTDILVTLNDPINIDPNSSSHQAVPVSADRWTAEDFKQTLCSLKVVDSGIFG
ncbi:hypothetical protein ACJMK2_008024 [Sinanodonta woodiana]